jgi:putative NADH-flavin reductase
MKIFLLGATGNSGGRLLAQALARDHSVTALVRNAAKLHEQIGGSTPPGLTIVEAELDDTAALAKAMTGHDVVINAAGHLVDGAVFPELVARVTLAAQTALGPGGRLWLFGGAGLLKVPGTDQLTLDLPKIPPMFEAHRTNLRMVETTTLDWSILCPGPIIDSDTGLPHAGLRIAIGEWPVDPPSALVRMLPKIALSLAFRNRLGEMTISYDDAALVILDNLAPGGPTSRQCVGVALPRGMKAHKAEVPS